MGNPAFLIGSNYQSYPLYPIHEDEEIVSEKLVQSENGDELTLTFSSEKTQTFLFPFAENPSSSSPPLETSKATSVSPLSSNIHQVSDISDKTVSQPSETRIKVYLDPNETTPLLRGSDQSASSFPSRQVKWVKKHPISSYYIVLGLFVIAAIGTHLTNHSEEKTSAFLKNFDNTPFIATGAAFLLVLPIIIKSLAEKILGRKEAF